MSSSLPQELVDLIIDCLRDDLMTLSVCCLISKAWVQRAREYLFANIEFNVYGRHVEQWERTFPYPTNSPAHNIRVLSIPQPNLITAAHADTLLTFCGVVRLDVDTNLLNDQWVSLAPLHGLSPVLKSFRLTFASLPNPDIFDLVCSFPLLEDLTLIARSSRHDHPAWNGPSTSPRFTGSFELRLREEIYPTVHQMLSLPNGLHFTSIAVSWCSGQDIKATMELVSKCPTTLESLCITNYFSGVFPPIPASRQNFYLQVENVHDLSIDLSRVTRLRGVELRCKRPNALWISQALRTIKSKSIEQVSLDISLEVFWGAPRAWLDLDSLLVQLWDLHSLRIKITHESPGSSAYGREKVERLLPQVIGRRVAEVVGRLPGLPKTLD